MSHKLNMKNIAMLSSLQHLGRDTERWNDFTKDVVVDLEAEPTDLNHISGPELRRFPPSVIREEFNTNRKWRKLYIGSVAGIRHWWVSVPLKLRVCEPFSAVWPKSWDAYTIYTQSQQPPSALTLRAKVSTLHCVPPRHGPPHGEVAAIPPIV